MNMLFAISSEKGFYFVMADRKLDNGDFIYRGAQYKADDNEEDIVTYSKIAG